MTSCKRLARACEGTEPHLTPNSRLQCLGLNACGASTGGARSAQICLVRSVSRHTEARHRCAGQGANNPCHPDLLALVFLVVIWWSLSLAHIVRAAPHLNSSGSKQYQP